MDRMPSGMGGATVPGAGPSGMVSPLADGALEVAGSAGAAFPAGAASAGCSGSSSSSSCHALGVTPGRRPEGLPVQVR
jgi:hypothetical protein